MPQRSVRPASPPAVSRRAAAPARAAGEAARSRSRRSLRDLPGLGPEPADSAERSGRRLPPAARAPPPAAARAAAAARSASGPVLPRPGSERLEPAPGCSGTGALAAIGERTPGCEHAGVESRCAPCDRGANRTGHSGPARQAVPHCDRGADAGRRALWPARRRASLRSGSGPAKPRRMQWLAGGPVAAGARDRGRRRRRAGGADHHNLGGSRWPTRPG